MARRKHVDVLPPPRSPEFLGGRIYTHFLLSPNVIERLKSTAFARGYKPGDFLQELLDQVLPRKVNRKVVKRMPARISLVRAKEAR